MLLLHALAAVGAGCYLLMYQDLDATCGSRIFCVDKLSSLLMDFHVGLVTVAFSWAGVSSAAGGAARLKMAVQPAGPPGGLAAAGRCATQRAGCVGMFGFRC